MNYCVLVPVYNEPKTIVKVIEELQNNGYNFLIVNDGSTDNTLDVIKQHTDKYISYSQNRGKGYAIKEGAKQLKDYDWVIIVDADGQTPIHNITDLFNLRFGSPSAKILIGNRLEYPLNMPTIHLLVNKIMSFIISLLVGQTIPDTQCGLKIIHQDIFNLDLKCDRFDFESEMLVKAGRAGCQIVSWGIDCIYFADRKSKMHPIKDALRFLKLIIKLL